MTKASRPLLRIDRDFRNTNNWKDPRDEFNSMFRHFPDGKGIANVQGIRTKSRVPLKSQPADVAFCVLITNLSETAWPDRLDHETGVFTYYGDNRQYGASLTEKPGNRLLADAFARAHTGQRHLVPPFLCFQTLQKDGAYMRFLGLAIPGATGLTSINDLTGVWRIDKGHRFENYRGIFTILNEAVVPWEWLDDLVLGLEPTKSAACPNAWAKWVESGTIDALQCLKTRTPRTKTEQLPHNSHEEEILSLVMTLSDREFEFAAKQILSLLDQRFVNLVVTPFKKDHGRDIIGNYQIGIPPHERMLSMYAEAKHWRNAVGVRPVARLLARLKRMDIGVFITSSCFDTQVQIELIEDDHPVILVSGGDIARILIASDKAGPGHEKQLAEWLAAIRLEANAASK